MPPVQFFILIDTAQISFSRFRSGTRHGQEGDLPYLVRALTRDSPG